MHKWKRRKYLKRSEEGRVCVFRCVLPRCSWCNYVAPASFLARREQSKASRGRRPCAWKSRATRLSPRSSVAADVQWRTIEPLLFSILFRDKYNVLYWRFHARRDSKWGPNDNVCHFWRELHNSSRVYRILLHWEEKYYFWVLLHSETLYSGDQFLQVSHYVINTTLYAPRKKLLLI